MKSDFSPWDKVRYTQDYLEHRELTVGIPYPFQDTYTIKKQLTRTAYLADGEKPEHRGRIVHPRGMEKIVEQAREPYNKEEKKTSQGLDFGE